MVGPEGPPTVGVGGFLAAIGDLLRGDPPFKKSAALPIKSEAPLTARPRPCPDLLPVRTVSLRNKIALILVAVVVGYLLLSYTILRAVVYPIFTELDEQTASTNLARVDRAIQTQLEHLRATIRDWAPWNDTYNFALGRNEDYVADNLDAASLLNLEINLALFFDSQGNLFWEEVAYPKGGDSLALNDVLIEPIAPGNRLIQKGSARDALTGLLSTHLGTMLVASHPILTTTFEGPPAGTMLMGRFFDAETIDSMRANTGVDFSVLLPGRGAMSPDAKEALARLAAGADGVLIDDRKGSLRNYKLLDDLYGAPALLIEVRTPTHVTAAGINTLHAAIAFLLLAAMIVMVVMWLLLHLLITTPVSALTYHIARIRKSGDLSQKVDFDRADEIGVLGDQFDALTDELASARREMAEARDAALESSRLKSEFLANMSHEIRTPMNGVLGMTELLLKTDLSAKQRRFGETVRRSAETLLGVINDILDFSKVEAGKLELEEVELDLREIVEDLGEMFAEAAHGKGLELVCTTTPPDMHTCFKGDPGRLRQVVTNLLANAIKFTERGEILVNVVAVKEDSDKTLIRFEVSDTGIGVPRGLRHKIFGSFVQADGSTTRQYGGTGLGLAISKQLVELMGGEIGVDSRPGKGSTFWFSLSLEKVSSESVRIRKANRSIEGLRVLVVDDNATNREILDHQLSAWDIQVESTDNGQEALSMLCEGVQRRQPFDLAILDMHMPALDGLQVARAIRQTPQLSELRLIMLSSVGPDVGEFEWKAAGIDRHITKPARQSALFDTIAEVIGPDAIVRHRLPEARTVNAESARDAPRGRILLAEDNPVNLLVTTEMLSELSFDVEAVENGKLAAERAISESYDLVLMDCQMPGMDGFEATAAIRERESRHSAPRLPIIALTANAMTGDRERCLAAGMDDYLSKPFSAGSLQETVERWIAPNQACQSTEKPLPADSASSEPPLSRPTDAVINQATLESIRSLGQQDDTDILSEIVGVFLSSSKDYLSAMSDSISRNDPEGARFAAHTLKSSSANVGADGLAALCRELEAMARERNMGQANEILAKIEHEYARASAALSKEIGSAAA